jgi:hypothetical protein
MRISAGHVIGAHEPAYDAVLVALNPVAIVTLQQSVSVTIYSMARLVPHDDHDMSAMLSRWSDGRICLMDQEDTE